MRSQKQTPSFHKGDIIVLHDNFNNPRTASVYGWHPTSSKDMDEWCAAYGGIGDDGETRLAPRETLASLVSDRRYLVLNGRVRGYRAYNTISNCCKILDPVTGLILDVERRHMKKLVAGETK